MSGRIQPVPAVIICRLRGGAVDNLFLSGMTWFSRGMGGGWGGGHSSPTASKGGTIGHGLSINCK